VHAGSPPEVKVAFFGALFAARTDLYAVRWENARTGQKGWLPAVRGGWRKGVPHAERDYLPLTAGVLGEGFDCPALDTLFLAAPIAFKGRLVQYVGRILRAYPGKGTAEVHDYHDVKAPVLAASLAKRAPGYTSLGFPDPRHLTPTPSTLGTAAPESSQDTE
jgi:hypothetical protein